MKTRINLRPNATRVSKDATSGVSLHCHSENSKEMLDWIPQYAAKLPVIAQCWRRERKNYIDREGKDIDFSTAFWSPPLSVNEVFESEKEQLNAAGLEAIVSLTDHDTIRGCLQLNENVASTQAPISLEWTVPFDYGFFHIGVHNLPKSTAVEITKMLMDYTYSQEDHSSERLTELFSMLHDLPSVLIVLNHPLWDIEMVGADRHKALLASFTRSCGAWIDALEFNGFRSWSENKAVIELAETLGMPVVSGGDRHGCKPNTVINLTNAQCFAEFVEEIRTDKRSELALLPEYQQPLSSRQLQSFADILKNYPEFPEGRKRWFDRVHFDIADGYGVRPLSTHWNLGGPRWLRIALWTLGVLGSPTFIPIFRILQKRWDRLPKTPAWAYLEGTGRREIGPVHSPSPVGFGR